MSTSSTVDTERWKEVLSRQLVTLGLVKPKTTGKVLINLHQGGVVDADVTTKHK